MLSSDQLSGTRGYVSPSHLQLWLGQNTDSYLCYDTYSMAITAIEFLAYLCKSQPNVEQSDEFVYTLCKMAHEFKAQERSREYYFQEKCEGFFKKKDECLWREGFDTMFRLRHEIVETYFEKLCVVRTLEL